MYLLQVGSKAFFRFNKISREVDQFQIKFEENRSKPFGICLSQKTPHSSFQIEAMNKLIFILQKIITYQCFSIKNISWMLKERKQ